MENHMGPNTLSHGESQAAPIHCHMENHRCPITLSHGESQAPHYTVTWRIT
ncbi:hypothetical protein DPMN_194356 [Dreissena polymorpha]|uniref:Uncharacterized protein n=1 Tax=Dreissena polymorpha TaxID=45954 RepID=A0A9D3Y2I5_DREPO|nr:hypothetical protein DPMN_194356 [Dreissena polymorpha]